MALRRTNLAVDVPNNLNRLFRRRLNYRNEVLAQLRMRTNLEVTLFSRLQTLIRQHIMKQAKNLIDSNYVPQRSRREFQELLTILLRRHYKKTFLAIYERNSNVYENLTRKDDAFDFSNVDFERVVTGYISRNELRLTGISRQLSKRLQGIIETGFGEGLTLTQIAKKLRDSAPVISRIRANTIARTETHNASSWANHKYHTDVTENLDLELKKRWVSVGDMRTRASHHIANNQVVPMHGNFIVGGKEMEYAGDPNGGASETINCRCVIIYEDSV
jgi:uncharacterized protein with gpF-like domain